MAVNPWHTSVGPCHSGHWGSILGWCLPTLHRFEQEHQEKQQLQQQLQQQLAALQRQQQQTVAR